MSQHLTTLIQTSGYFGIFFAMALESCCIPIPSEVIMPFGGYLVLTGQLHFWPVVLMGVLGNVVGSWIAYYIGTAGGRPLILRYGKYVRLSERHLSQAETWFGRRGQTSVLIGRVLPIVRTFISLPAGIAKMPFGKFTIYTAIGSLPWVYVLTWAGTYLGRKWEGVSRYVHPLTYAVAVLIVLFILLFVVRKLRNRSGS